MMGIHMHRDHPVVLQELPQVEPVMACRLHAWYYLVHPVLFLQFHDPGSERLEPFLCIAEFQRLSGEFISPPVECPCEVCFTPYIDAKDQSFFRNSCNLCVLCGRLHIRYLSCNGFANCRGSANLILH